LTLLGGDVFAEKGGELFDDSLREKSITGRVKQKICSGAM